MPNIGVTMVGTSGSMSQMTMRLTSGCRTKVPAVTPAPQATTSTDSGFLCTSAGMCPSMRWSRMSAGRVDAWILPAPWKLRTPSLVMVTATETFVPSPT